MISTLDLDQPICNIAILCRLKIHIPGGRYIYKNYYINPQRIKMQIKSEKIPWWD